MTLFIAYRDVTSPKYKVFGDFPAAAAWALDGQEKPEFIIDGDQVVPGPAVTPENFRAVYQDLDAALASIADMLPTARRAAAAELHALADALYEFGDSDALAT
jgi:hypothetical protein